MPVPTWNVGEVLASGDVNSWFVPRAIKATSDQSRTSAPALANDTALAITLDATADYVVWCRVVFTGPGTNGAPFNFTGPASSTASFSIPVNGTAGGGNNDVGMNSGIVGNFGISTTGTGTAVTADIFGRVTTSSSGGTLQFQWAQTSSSATATTRKAGSFLYAQRIG